jgi:hypothetical protein
MYVQDSSRVSKINFLNVLSIQIRNAFFTFLKLGISFLHYLISFLLSLSLSLSLSVSISVCTLFFSTTQGFITQTTTCTNVMVSSIVFSIFHKTFYQQNGLSRQKNIAPNQSGVQLWLLVV